MAVAVGVAVVALRAGRRSSFFQTHQHAHLERDEFTSAWDTSGTGQPELLLLTSGSASLSLWAGSFRIPSLGAE